VKKNSASALSTILLCWRQKPGDTNMYGNVLSFSRQCRVCSGSEATPAC
jgi:hypothetical protein